VGKIIYVWRSLPDCLLYALKIILPWSPDDLDRYPRFNAEKDLESTWISPQKKPQKLGQNGKVYTSILDDFGQPMSHFLSFLSLKKSVEQICQAIEAPEMGVAWDYSAFIVHMATAFLVTAVVSASVCRDSMAGCEDSS